jgi:hypothetical protein
MNRKPLVALAGAVPALALAFAPSAALAEGGDNLIRGDLTPSMPTDDPINGVNPGGLPWVIDRGAVRVRESGRMDVRIEGLQIPFPAPDVTRNPIPFIHAVLYCDGAMAADSGAQPMTVPGGDSRFRVHLMVPKMCEMPSVLIQPNNALTGAPAPAYIASLVAMDDD